MDQLPLHSLKAIPNELTMRIVEGLSVDDLEAYCESSQSALSLCSDSYFWTQKIKNMSRREIQEDWLVRLAKSDNRRLLSYLLDALDDLGFLIDQRIVVLSLMHLYANYAEGQVVKRLEKRLDRSYVDDRVVGRHDANLREYTLFTYTDTIKEIQAWIDGTSHSLKVGVYDLNDPTQLFVNTILDPELVTHSSPSSFLGLVVTMRPEKQIEILNTLRTFLAPYAAAKRRIAHLMVYREDLEIMKPLYEKALTLYGWPSDTILVNLFHSVIIAMSLDNAKKIFPEDWTEILAAEEESPLLCRHADTFKYVTRLIDYTPERCVHGYISMEADEWIQWFESLPDRVETETKLLIAQWSVIEATEHGYTYFAEMLEHYLNGESRE